MRSLKYFPELDGLRGISALMIIFFHFFQGVDALEYNLITKILVFGQTGVTLFFVLSGFLISRILLDTKNEENFFRNFYVRRSLRIFPLYYLFLLMIYVLYPLILNNKIRFEELWYYFIYLQGLAVTFNWPTIGPGHFWSLAVEEHSIYFGHLLFII